MYENVGFDSDPQLRHDTFQQLLDTPYTDFNSPDVTIETLLEDDAIKLESSDVMVTPKPYDEVYNSPRLRCAKPEELLDEYYIDPNEKDSMIKLIKERYPHIDIELIKTKLKQYNY